MDAVDPVVLPIAVPRPIDQSFSYLAPREWLDRYAVGNWVKIPFGRATTHGYIVGAPTEVADLPPGVPRAALKTIIDLGDPKLAMPKDVFELCEWASRYYGAPLGEVMNAALPAAAMGLRSQKKEAREVKGNAPSEAHAIEPNEDQRAAVEGLDRLRRESPGKPALLQGVTGSGKTEVYIEIAKRVLAEGKSVLLLVPEIALTSQLTRRLEEGLGQTVGRWHSAMPDGARRDLYSALIRGAVRVVVGARSAIFAPMKDLGLILVDEEHDATYKQEDRVRYHARDLAVVRGARKASPALVVLGSATPSLETLERVREGKYAFFDLPKRHHSGGLPTLEIVDLCEEPQIDDLQAAIAEKTLKEIRDTIARGEQVMVFLNRRGFAQFLLCEDCQRVMECPNCSISLTVHKRTRDLRCHVCGHQEMVPGVCDKCQGMNFIPVGAGTESLEEELPPLLLAQPAEEDVDLPAPKALGAAETRILRLDRDVITSNTRLEKTLEAFRSGEASVLLGTQMLAKGHDFPKVTLVVIVLADALFRFPDFRASERAIQMLTQVAGRAGRGDIPGKVLIQTYDPNHRVLEVLTGRKPLAEFLEEERELRKESAYPPFARIAKFRIEHSEGMEAKTQAQDLVRALKRFLDASGSLPEGTFCEILGPSEAFLERAKGIYRWDCLVKTNRIDLLQRLVRTAKDFSAQRKAALLVDVDPYGLG